ncbi:DDE-type integrase/transposase/recombinase [Bacillaceae bacterium SIJ1]|uniref:DDE-type integrase/transposase/recombinase n=1 Tax=Litoribacterium kuwaitense TaxID=1398745 RepID=UPI0013ECD37B|nr:DDE-type integrase/transposase/recombinase [Litoribacterium kuwaitense]NGP46855.1 DDE-type integrase/transposase/recombinase [Litoribacterium kuwaitense]
MDRPGKVWVSDITYIWTSEGWLYLASVMDLYSRRVIGWDIRDRMTKELVITALKRAMITQPPMRGLILIPIKEANMPPMTIKHY